MSTTTDMMGVWVCVWGVFSYNTRFSCLWHAVHMPLCPNLLSVHAHFVPFVCVERSHYTIRLYMERVVSIMCVPVAFLLLENTYTELLISQTTQQVILTLTKWTWGNNHIQNREGHSVREKEIFFFFFWREKDDKCETGRKRNRRWGRSQKENGIVKGERSSARCGIWCSSALLWMKTEVFLFLRTRF